MNDGDDSLPIPDPQRKLKEGEEYFLRMLGGVRDYAILMLGADGRILTWNAGARTMRGYGAQEIIGQPFSRFFTEADLQAQKPCKLLEIAARDGRVSDEGWRVRKDGSRFWAYVVITAFHDETGTLQGYATITRDMTEHQETLQRLETANQRLRELDEAKSFTISVASHELRSPLTSIKGYVENLVEGVAGPLPEQVLYYLTRIDHNVDRVIRMTNMLLDLSRIESGQMALQLGTVCTKEVITHVLRDLKPLAEKKGITVQAEDLVDVPVRADRHKLEQVFLNLVHNALKFTPEQGHLIVRSNVTTDHRLTITVADTGCGIPREHHDKVFEKFHRAPSPVHEGSGLGLAITRKLVELQGGTISLESEPGHGSRFFVSLPQAGAQPSVPY
ncbi:MAG: sensor hybrid histidine kinase [Nitrospira sp.]|jgi:PAS domain S-box-containing protein|nr:sensor hybrid histidine kinase [Nitrospira sp.]